MRVFFEYHNYQMCRKIVVSSFNNLWRIVLVSFKGKVRVCGSTINSFDWFQPRLASREVGSKVFMKLCKEVKFTTLVAAAITCTMAMRNSVIPWPWITNDHLIPIKIVINLAWKHVNLAQNSNLNSKLPSFSKLITVCMFIVQLEQEEQSYWYGGELKVSRPLDRAR